MTRIHRQTKFISMILTILALTISVPSINYAHTEDGGQQITPFASDTFITCTVSVSDKGGGKITGGVSVNLYAAYDIKIVYVRVQTRANSSAAWATKASGSKDASSSIFASKSVTATGVPSGYQVRVTAYVTANGQSRNPVSSTYTAK